MDYSWLAIGISMLISLYFTYFYVGRAQNETRLTLESLGSQLTEGIQGLNEELEPLHNAVSRSMGAISSVADSNKMDKALERRIGQDTMDQLEGEYGDVLEGIRMAFPRVAEYLEERPEAITKLLPRLNTLISDPDTRKRLNLDFKEQSSDIDRIHREG